MPVRAFVDSNILLYSLSSDLRKASRCDELSYAGGVISVQVLNEFVNVARRKHKTPWEQIRPSLKSLRTLFEVEPLTVDIHEMGLNIAESLTFGMFDSLLIAAALKANCDVFWSEDLQHGQVIEGRLTVRNPFV